MKEIGALGSNATKVGLVQASMVDLVLLLFKVDAGVRAKFTDARRTAKPPACRHRAGAAARDHLVR